MFSVTNFSVPVADFDANPQTTTIIDAQVYFVNKSTILNANTYSWDIAGLKTASTLNTDYFFTYSGNFEVTLKAENEKGCVDSITKIVKVIPDVVIFVPNSFTPGADGLNDVFQIFSPPNGIDYSTFKINIYDRWGTEVFKSNDITVSWNGSKYNSGNILKSDTYVYRITYSGEKGKDFEKVGHVNLLRK